MKRNCAKPPLILVTPSTEQKGVEFGDTSLSLSEMYDRAVMAGGGLPLVMPCTTSRDMVAECVRRADGVLLTGGDDVNPALYADGSQPGRWRAVGRPDRDRDLRELMVIDEVFRQRKPLLAVCRGHQLLNVALGGSLLLDIGAQCPGALNHRRLDRKSAVVHDVRLTAGSLLAKITAKQTLGVNSTHHQAVDRVAGILAVAAASSDGIVESLQLRPQAFHALSFLLSVQFHPERLLDRHAEHLAIFRSFIGACMLNRDKKL
jgi:putative glutamine amidotransferase